LSRFFREKPNLSSQRDAFGTTVQYPKGIPKTFGHFAINPPDPKPHVKVADPFPSKKDVAQR